MADASDAYAITTVINCLNMTALWFGSGAVRTLSKTTPNAEDARTMVKDAAVVGEDPPAVARVLRVHANTFANTVPFLLLAQAYVAAGAEATAAWVIFGTFTAARVLYSIVYLRGLQPWRSIAYGAGLLTTLALMVHLAALALG
ncbi:MAG: MAPEG family protein [Myxococcales bacterium]|nr:MAPEG family protein [Myxococcales bacterium]